MMVVCVESCKRFDIYPFSEILVLVHVRMQVARATPQTYRLHPHSLHREPAQLKRTTWDSSRYPAALQRPHNVSLASSCSAWTLHCWMATSYTCRRCGAPSSCPVPPVSQLCRAVWVSSAAASGAVAALDEDVFLPDLVSGSGVEHAVPVR